MFIYTTIAVAVSISIFILGSRSLSQIEIITLEPLKKVKSEPAKPAGEFVQSLAPQLDALMNEEKIYTDSTWTIWQKNLPSPTTLYLNF